MIIALTITSIQITTVHNLVDNNLLTQLSSKTKTEGKLDYINCPIEMNTFLLIGETIH
jgi:hypothetical protein